MTPNTIMDAEDKTALMSTINDAIESIPHDIHLVDILNLQDPDTTDKEKTLWLVIGCLLGKWNFWVANKYGSDSQEGMITLTEGNAIIAKQKENIKNAIAEYASHPQPDIERDYDDMKRDAQHDSTHERDP